MYGAKAPLLKSPPASKPINAPPGQEFNSTGGTVAPSGRSAAGRMVNNRRQQQRQNVPHARPRSQPPGKSSGKGHQGGGGGGASKPYNALESPYKNVGEFNKAVQQTAQAEYQPELNQLNTEQRGEYGLHNERESENTGTYQQYSAQAKEAYERAKNAAAEIAARSNAGSDAAQKALQAALSNTGVSGVSPVQNSADFMQEATGFGNQTNQTLGGIQSAVLGQANQGTLIPGAWLGEEQKEERNRDEAKEAEIKGKRQNVLAGIPGIQSKVRGELSKQEQERQTNKLQAEIAKGKLGNERAETRNKRAGEIEGNKTKRAGEREANAIKAHEIAINSGFEAEKIKLEREKIGAAIAEAKNGKEKAAAELHAKRFDHGLEIMAGYLKIDPKTEFHPTGDPAKDQALEENGKKQPFRRDAMQLYQQLTKQGNLTAPEAFTMMETSGNGYVEKFAREHRAIYERATRERQDANARANQKAHQFQNLPKGNPHGKLTGQGVK